MRSETDFKAPFWDIVGQDTAEADKLLINLGIPTFLLLRGTHSNKHVPIRFDFEMDLGMVFCSQSFIFRTKYFS